MPRLSSSQCWAGSWPFLSCLHAPGTCSLGGLVLAAESHFGWFMKANSLTRPLFVHKQHWHHHFSLWETENRLFPGKPAAAGPEKLRLLINHCSGGEEETLMSLSTRPLRLFFVWQSWFCNKGRNIVGFHSNLLQGKNQVVASVKAWQAQLAFSCVLRKHKPLPYREGRWDCLRCFPFIFHPLPSSHQPQTHLRILFSKKEAREGCILTASFSPQTSLGFNLRSFSGVLSKRRKEKMKPEDKRLLKKGLPQARWQPELGICVF